MCRAVQILFFSAGIFFTLLFDAKAADQYDKLAVSLVRQIHGGYKFAVAPIDRSSSKITAGFSQAITERLTNAVQRELSGSGHSLVERSRLKDIMREQEEFKGVEEFSKLLEGAGADIVIFPNVSRIDKTTIELSARGVGVSSIFGGKVFSASKTIRLKAPVSYAVAVHGVLYKGKIKSNYRNSLIAGLSGLPEIKISNVKGIYGADFKATSTIDFNIAAKDTAEAKEARQGQKVLKAFGSFGGFGGGNNPLSGIMSSISKSTNPNELKIKQISATVETKLLNLIDKSIVVSQETGKKTLPFTASSDELKNALKSLVKQLIERSGQSVAYKIVGRFNPAPNKTKKGSSSDSMLD